MNEDLENKLQQLTQELEENKKDLETFSYSVSHDLRAPLRAIDGFSQLLEEKYASTFDEESKKDMASTAARFPTCLIKEGRW